MVVPWCVSQGWLFCEMLALVPRDLPPPTRIPSEGRFVQMEGDERPAMRCCRGRKVPATPHAPHSSHVDTWYRRQRTEYNGNLSYRMGSVVYTVNDGEFIEGPAWTTWKKGRKSSLPFPNGRWSFSVVISSSGEGALVADWQTGSGEF